ncbi:MAG: BamA/TamA family outer membrane protein, partial [Gemmatimonadota bacterium]
LASPAEAQSTQFGKNKVQYTDFEWQILSGENVDVYFYPEEEDVARMALVFAEESFLALQERFQHHPFQRPPVVVYASQQDFQQTNVTGGFIPDGVLGFTEFLKGRIALPFRGSYSQFRHTLRHEMAHYFQLSKVRETYEMHRAGRNRVTLPHWWTEGLAEYLSSPQDTRDEMVIRDIALTGRIPSLRDFSRSVAFLAYPLGGELHHYLADRFGERRIIEMYEEIWRYDSFAEAFHGVYGISLDELDAEWRYHLEERYFPLRAERPPLEVDADRVLRESGPHFKPLVGSVPGNPTLQLFYMSPSSGYTNIYQGNLPLDGRAPVASGIRAIVEGQRSSDFEALHAYESRIDLSDEGILAFVSQYQERDALYLWDVAKKKLVGRYQWDDLVGLRSPAWSPEGDKVVFSGLSIAGTANLYVVDFDRDERTALTDDRYEDLDPDWSPDGRFIVFSSDRTPFGMSGSKNLFLLDVEGGSVSYLTYGDWLDEAPRWSGDGSRVAFTSDRTGLFEIYTVRPDGRGERVSNFTGAAMDPEWLPDGSGIVFGGYTRGTFLLHHLAVDPGDADGAADRRIAIDLPPNAPAPYAPTRASASDGSTADTSDSAPDRRIAYAGDGVATDANGSRTDSRAPGEAGDRKPTDGADTDSPTANWDWVELAVADTVALDRRAHSPTSTFSMDFLGGDALVVPGVGAMQGIQFMGSDMLGDHVLHAGISASQGGSFRSLPSAFSGQLTYLNMSRRLNIGGGIFRHQGVFRDVARDLYEESSYGAFFLATYPFSRYERLELRMGVEHSDRVDRESTYMRDRREDPLDVTRKALITRNTLSYVKDNTLWLPYGPIDGSRYNVSAGLVTDLTHGRAESVVLSGDYRHYLRTSRHSAVALRGFGYFSTGAIPGRTVLGGSHQLRGYPNHTLAGSRVWLVNSEWRFPLLHALTFHLPIGNVTFPGLQGAFFADAGSSWLENQSPEGTWGSYGMSFRMNLGAPMVLR